jgi:hypothetical protein
MVGIAEWTFAAGKTNRIASPPEILIIPINFLAGCFFMLAHWRLSIARVSLLLQSCG